MNLDEYQQKCREALAKETDFLTFTEKQLSKRRTQYQFSEKAIPKKLVDTILKNANGPTPSLCNIYDYRVDVIPDEFKEILFRSAITIDEKKNPDIDIEKAKEQFDFSQDFESECVKWIDDVCLNPQHLAPLVLSFSIPNVHSWGTDTIDKVLAYADDDSFEIGRDTTMIGLALNIWHVVMVTQELGLDHAFAAGFDYEYLQRKLKIESDIRGRTYDMMPVCFLCIGYGLEDKETEEDREQINILNTSTIEKRPKDWTPETWTPETGGPPVPIGTFWSRREFAEDNAVIDPTRANEVWVKVKSVLKNLK